jgi:hypothetical protein
LSLTAGFRAHSVAFHSQLRLDVARFWEGSTMRNSKIAILCYGLAVGFVLVVAFHSPAKVVVAADAPAPTAIINAK